jgi:hypothetical protein
MRMSKVRWLRLQIWSSVTVAVLLQAAFLLELHTPMPSRSVLWSLSGASVACLVILLLARRGLATNAKLSYAPDTAYPQRRFDAGAAYPVQGDYCVILCRRPLVDSVHYPHTKSLYLSEGSAERAVLTASVENPQWRAIGVEPSNLSARVPQRARSRSASETWDVA